MKKENKKVKETPFFTDINIRMVRGVFFMRINRLNNIFQIYNKNSKTNKTSDGRKTDGKDEIKLSEKAIEFQHALKKVREVEDIRYDKVEKIKAQVKSGTYYVDGKKIAEKMLEDMGFNKKI